MVSQPGVHAVDRHGAALSAQLLDQTHGVEQHEVKVVVDALSIDEADINLFCAGWQVGVADPA